MKLVLTVALVFLAITGFSQQISFPGVSKFHRGALTPIYEGTEVKGYITFYRSDKADRKNNAYGIQVLDENLNKVKNIELIRSKKTYFIGNSYNGSVFCLHFYNDKESQFEMEAYDHSLNKVGSAIIDDFSPADKGYVQQVLNSGNTDNQTATGSLKILPVKNKGFIRTSTIGMAKSYKVVMYDNNMQEVWTLEGEDSKNYESLGINSVGESYATGAIGRRPGLFSKKIEVNIVALDLATGKKVIDMPIENGEGEQLSVSQITFDEQKKQFLVIGEFYGEKDKPFVDKSQGMFIRHLTTDGKDAGTKFYAWDKEVKAKLSAEALASIEDKFINYIHTMITDADNNMYIVAEQYKIQVSGAGLAMKALGGGGSMMKGKVGNLLIFRLSPAGDLTHTNFIAKGETDVSLPSGSGMFGVSLLGHIINSMNGFDFKFSQTDNDNTVTELVYLDINEKEKETDLINLQVSGSGKFSSDKIDLTTEKNTSVYIYPAKMGHNMVVEYNSKEDTLVYKLIRANNEL